MVLILVFPCFPVVVAGILNIVCHPLSPQERRFCFSGQTITSGRWGLAHSLLPAAGAVSLTWGSQEAGVSFCSAPWVLSCISPVKARVCRGQDRLQCPPNHLSASPWRLEGVSAKLALVRPCCSVVRPMRLASQGKQNLEISRY